MSYYFIGNKKNKKRAEEQFDIEEVPESEESPSPIRQHNDKILDIANEAAVCIDTSNLLEPPSLLVLNKVETAHFIKDSDSVQKEHNAHLQTESCNDSLYNESQK